MFILEKILPAYDFWAPWIAPSSIDGSEVLNTEYEKLKHHGRRIPEVIDNEAELSEEYVIELLCESSVSTFLLVI